MRETFVERYWKPLLFTGLSLGLTLLVVASAARQGPAPLLAVYLVASGGFVAFAWGATEFVAAVVATLRRRPGRRPLHRAMGL